VKKAELTLTHARHDPAHCLAPGLFRSLERGERKKQKLDITYTYSVGETAQFTCFEPLGSDDLRVLQGLVAMAGADGTSLSPEPKTENGRHLRELIDPKFDASGQRACMVRSAMRRLLAEIGLSSGGKSMENVVASLHRMANVTVLVKKDSRQASFRLLSYAFDSQDGALLVALNPQLAGVALGDVKKHARIEMSEVRALHTSPARLIHQRLCGWINPGKSGKVEVDTLCGYVWPEETNPEAMKKRRQIARRALKELAALGWTVDEYATDKWEIRRPKLD